MVEKQRQPFIFIILNSRFYSINFSFLQILRVSVKIKYTPSIPIKNEKTITNNYVRD